MIERQMELKRRYTRKDKMRKLKKKLGTAVGEVREKILYKIRRLSPAWTEASLTQGLTTAASTTPKEVREPRRKPAAPAKGKPQKA